MKSVLTVAAAAIMMLSAQAVSLSDGNHYNVTEPEPELVYHTAAPGIIVAPRSDLSEMVMAYDVTLIPREDQVYCRWRSLGENGEGVGFWTKWTDYSHSFKFTKPGRYVLEAYALAIGKEESPHVNVTFKVDYLGMTLAPGIILTPEGQRGYYITLTSFYGDDIYYRWRHYESEMWNKWRLYTEALPFTEAGQYVIEANCEGDPLGAYLTVPPVDYYHTGDVDHNGSVNINDVTALINMLLNDDLALATGDVNRDGIINMDDLITLISMLLELY